MTEDKWIPQIDQPLTNRKARRHPQREHSKKGYTKSNKSKR